MFIEIMANQRKYLAHLSPDMTLSSVRANEVLLKAAAKMEKVPLMFPSKPICPRF